MSLDNIYLRTNQTLLNFSLFLLRATLGIILFVAGSGKVLGWFDGKGIQATIDTFTTKLGIPEPLAYLSCYTEFLGGALLILGLLTRPAAFAVMINMLVATSVVMPKGFFGPGGAAYPFSLMIVALVIVLSGPMGFSLDRLLSSRELIRMPRTLGGKVIGKQQIAH
jgi:putative oxidoreductase